jgi:hypothetical protein
VTAIDNKGAQVEIAAAAAVAKAHQSPKAVKAERKSAVAATVAGRPLPAVIKAVDAAELGRSLPAALDPPVSDLLKSWYNWPASCGAADGQTSSQICHFGDVASKRLLVVIGDSHAEMWMPAILSMAQRDHWNVVPLSKSACLPREWYDGKQFGECHAWYQWMLRQVKALHPDVILTSGCCGFFDESMGQAQQRSYLSLAAATRRYTKHFVIIGDNVGVDRQPVDCLLASQATMQSCTTVWPDYRFYGNQSLDVLAGKHRVGYIDTSGWFCWQDACPMVVGNTIVYIDTGHITDQYAENLSAPFRAAFLRSLDQARSS